MSHSNISNLDRSWLFCEVDADPEPVREVLRGFLQSRAACFFYTFREVEDCYRLLPSELAARVDREFPEEVITVEPSSTRGRSVLRLRSPTSDAYPRPSRTGFLWSAMLNSLARAGFHVSKEGGAGPPWKLGHADGDQFRLTGAQWFISFDGEQTFLGDYKGLHYIRHLLANPGTLIDAVALVQIVQGTYGGSGSSPDELEDGLGTTRLGGSSKLIDAQTRQETRERLIEIGDEIATATIVGKYDQVQELQDEKEEIEAYLLGAIGKAGKTRWFKTPHKKASNAVWNTIKYAITKIADRLPALAKHLRNTIGGGQEFAYRPGRDPEHATVDWRT